MKKIVFLLSLGSLLFSANVKNSEWFVNVSYGKIKSNDTNNMYGGEIGYYFYDPNIYKIGNRIYVDLKKVDSDDKFYVGSMKLDWIINNSSFVAPYVGVNVGYIYYKQNNTRHDANIWGGQGGLLVAIGDHFQIDLSATYYKPTTNQKFWSKNIKTISAGIGVSF